MPRKPKKENRERAAASGRAVVWMKGMQAEGLRIAKAHKQAGETALGMVHDVQATVSLVLRASEEFVRRECTAAEPDFDALPEHARRLVKTIEVLNGRAQLVPLAANPAAVTFGQRHAMPLYRVVDRLVRIFRPIDPANKQTLSIVGQSNNRVQAFDSLESVPFILLDNAVKYGHSQYPIEVEVHDEDRAVRVSISTVSPVVLDVERPLIFQRGYRGESARKLMDKGTGLGLFVAQQIAEAHGSRIRLESGKQLFHEDGIGYSMNRFYFKAG